MTHAIAHPNNLSPVPTVARHELENWEGRRSLFAGLRSDFPMARLGLLLREENHKPRLNEYSNQEFNILGINNKNGIFEADRKKTAQIRHPYKQMEYGWLAYNPYRINVGSIGIKTTTQPSDLISPAYIVFSCKPQIIPQYLYLVLKTRCLAKIIDQSTTGAVRPILSFSMLKKFTVPLPTLKVQEELVSRYFAEMDQAEVREMEAFAKDQEVTSYLLKELGITFDAASNNQEVRTISFRWLDHWAVDRLLPPNVLNSLADSKYDTQRLRQFLVSSQYGTSVKPSTQSSGVPIIRMNNLVDGKLDVADLKFISPAEAKAYAVKGDLFFNRTNSKELVGKTAVFDLEGEYAFASYLIRLKLDETKVNVYFINYLFNSPIIRMQIDQISRPSISQANVNNKELQDLIFPIPPRAIQDRIEQFISNGQKVSRQLKAEADALRKKALDQFEKAIFNSQL